MLGNYSEGSCVFAEDGKRWRLRLPEIEKLKKVDGEGISKEKRFVNQITTLIRLIPRDASFLIETMEEDSE